MSRIVVCLDLDGVLCDFIKPALVTQGLPAVDPTEWNPPGFDVSRIEKLPASFWAGLPVELEGDMLVEMLSRYETMVVTHAPSLAARTGKYQWLLSAHPHLAERLVCLREKWLLASPRHVLVDDNEENVRLFREAGGHAFLWPQPWNSGRQGLPALEDMLWKLWSTS